MYSFSLQIDFIRLSDLIVWKESYASFCQVYIVANYSARTYMYAPKGTFLACLEVKWLCVLKLACRGIHTTFEMDLTLQGHNWKVTSATSFIINVNRQYNESRNQIAVNDTVKYVLATFSESPVWFEWTNLINT